ncbi:MAG: hypothetical protein KC505_05770 [Myxococcales bacterium]|nr:hypothetical protein [Myxococcales bacterium]
MSQRHNPRPKKVDWALDKEANIQKPPSAIQQKGWQHEDIPTASNFNWIIHQLSKWDDYLDTEMRYHSAYVDGFRNSVDQDIAKIRKYLKTITQVLSALTIRVSKEHPHPQMILEKLPDIDRWE